MPNISELKRMLFGGAYDSALEPLYGAKTRWASGRFCALADVFAESYGEAELRLFSAPGRTEIGGNHTDHNRGRVLAASINLDVAAVAAASGDGSVKISSQGHDENVVGLDLLEPVENERGNSTSLVRGMSAAFAAKGVKPAGFRACTVSDVFTGSGLSSSAAYETLVGVMLAGFSGGRADAVEIAKMAQYAENNYYGKPSGLMDQMACSVGGLITIDFKDPAMPEVRKVNYDFAASGHVLCITGPIGSHAGLDDEYASVPREMRRVAEFFGKEYLREVDPDEFYSLLPKLYGKLPERAILRAMHFFAENDRVSAQVKALEAGDFERFLELVAESGRSSFMYLQNVHTEKFQGLALALAHSEKLLCGSGAFRVHGGGFAGTIQAFVPFDMAERYRAGMDAMFGEGACHSLTVRPVGATEIVL